MRNVRFAARESIRRPVAADWPKTILPKAGGKLSVLQYFPGNTGNIPGFSGTFQDMYRYELSPYRHFAFLQIALTANPLAVIFSVRQIERTLFSV